MSDVSDLRAALQELSELRRRVYSTTQLYTVSRASYSLVEYCAQKPDPFLDGFGEANPWKRSSNKSEPEASKRSRDIDQLLVPSNKIQIVCLGAPESGFDEILRKINWSRSLSTAELDGFKHYLKQNLLTVLRHVTHLASPSLSENNQKLHKKLLRDDYGTNFDGIMTVSIADALRSLWRDSAVQHVYNSISSSPFVTDLIGHLTIDGIIKFVDHLQDPSFVPTELDTDHFFDKATGIREVILQSEQSENQIQLLDLTNLPVVGEGDFCKHSWVSQFQKCNFIYCYIPLHTYDEKIDQEEDPATTPTNSNNQVHPQSNPPAQATTPDGATVKTTNLIKSKSMGTSLPYTKSNPPATRERSNSTNAKYSSSLRSTLRTVPSAPAKINSKTAPLAQSTTPPTQISINTTPPTQITTPPTQMNINTTPPAQRSVNTTKQITSTTATNKDDIPSTTSLFTKTTNEDTIPSTTSLFTETTNDDFVPPTPPRASTLPPQDIDFFDGASDPLSPKRKVLYRNTTVTKPNTSHNFVRRTVQEKKHKSIHIAASHRFNSPSTSPVGSPSSSPLFHTHSPPSPSPSPPSSSSPLSSPTSLTQPSNPLPTPSSTSQSKSSRKLSGSSFLVISTSPPSSPTITPSSPPRASQTHSNPFLAPLKGGRRKSLGDLLAPFERMRSNTISLIPTPSLGPSSHSSSSSSSSFSRRGSVTFGSLSAISPIALPATPTLADIFKLPCYLKRFSALVNEDSLLQVPVLVTFVVTPAFSEKIKEVDLDICFPEYEGASAP